MIWPVEGSKWLHSACLAFVRRFGVAWSITTLYLSLSVANLVSPLSILLIVAGLNSIGLSVEDVPSRFPYCFAADYLHDSVEVVVPSQNRDTNGELAAGRLHGALPVLLAVLSADLCSVVHTIEYMRPLLRSILNLLIGILFLWASLMFISLD